MCKIFCLNTFLSFLVKISVLKWLSHIKSVYFKEPVTTFCNMSVLFGFLLATYESYSCFLLLLEIFSIDDPPDRWSNPKWPVLQTYTDKQECLLIQQVVLINLYVDVDINHDNKLLSWWYKICDINQWCNSFIYL